MDKARGKDPLWSVFESGDRPAPSPIPQFVPAVERPARPILVQDPAYWEEDFGRWALARCLFRDRCWWSAAALHDAFCGWCGEQETVACMAETFMALLQSEGFTLGDGATAGMVYGLVLKTEYLALTEPTPEPEPEHKREEKPTWIGDRR